MRQSGRHGDEVLLRNPDLDESLRILLPEQVHLGALGEVGAQGDHPLVRVSRGNQAATKAHPDRFGKGGILAPS